MKEGWTYKKLGEVCEILDSRRKPITKSKRETGTIPYYGATGLLDYVKDYIFDERLVLLGEDGAKWGSGENSSYIIEGKSWVNNHAHVLRPKRDILVDELLVYYLNFSNLLPYITGVTVPKLNQEKMRSIEIPIGPIDDQLSIVSNLDAAFAHIDALKSNAEKQLAEARQLFQAELAECMKPKEGWEEKTLKSICKINSGKSIKADLIVPVTSNDVLVPCYGGNGLRGYVSEANCAGLNPIIGRVGAQCGNIHYSQEPFYATEHALVVTLLDDDVNPLWLCRQLEYMDLKQYAEGAAQPVIAAGRLLGLIIAIPPLIEQQKIVSRLDALSANIKKLEEVQRKTLVECDALKQAMLREVFE